MQGRPHRGGQAMRGPYRGRGRPQHQGRSSLPNVPSITQVVSGAGVSIVLKEDQSTGREVQGMVQDVLTSGNHPRGIKVRLSDGRVGRVQRMVDAGVVNQPANHGPGELEVVSNAAAQRASVGTGGAQPIKYRDVRLDDEPEEPSSTTDLFAYVKPAKQKRGKGKNAQAQDEPVQPAASATCPVCGGFEGDEAAVAHHVESHFT